MLCDRRRGISAQKLSFGFMNAPPFFQRTMVQIFGSIPGLNCYPDDIVIASDNEEEHIASITEFFRRCAENNIKLRLDKCALFQNRIKFLGHIITYQNPEPNSN